MVPASETIPIAVALAPRAAVVTSGSSTRISRIDPAAPRGSSAASMPDSVLEKRIQVPVTLELTGEELSSGARVRLVLDIDLTTMRVTVEHEEKTGTR